MWRVPLECSSKWTRSAEKRKSMSVLSRLLPTALMRVDSLKKYENKWCARSHRSGFFHFFSPHFPIGLTFSFHGDFLCLGAGCGLTKVDRLWGGPNPRAATQWQGHYASQGAKCPSHHGTKPVWAEKIGGLSQSLTSVVVGWSTPRVCAYTTTSQYLIRPLSHLFINRHYCD